MPLIKRILGFNSPYSWTKWVRMSFAAVALLITLAFIPTLVSMALMGGIAGVLIALLVALLILGPTLAAMLGLSLLAGMIIGAVFSGRKQAKSIAESKATGDEEMIALEKQRIKVQLMNVLFVLFIVVILIVASGLAGVIGNSYYGNDFTAAIPLVVALILIACFWFAKRPMTMRYKAAFKEQVVVKGLAAVLQNMDFRPAEKLDEAIVKASELLSGYTNYDGNDYLAAAYNGIPFTQSDLHLTEQHEETYRDRDGDYHTRTVTTTIFRGRFMVLDYDAISNETVMVVPRGRKANRDEILTELDSFNQQFSVISKDAASAFRILTPPMLEGIVLARSKMGCPFAMSYKDDKIYMAIFNGDSFEATTSGDTTPSEQRGRVASEIEAMLGLVETLYLKRQSV